MRQVLGAIEPSEGKRGEGELSRKSSEKSSEEASETLTCVDSVDETLSSGRSSSRRRDVDVLGVVLDARRRARRAGPDALSRDEVSVDDGPARVIVEPELVEDAGLAVDVDASSVLGLEERLDLGEGVGLEERNGNSQSSAKDWSSKRRSD